MDKFIIKQVFDEIIVGKCKPKPSVDFNLRFYDGSSESIEDIFGELENSDDVHNVYDLNVIKDNILKKFPNFELKSFSNTQFTLFDRDFNVTLNLGEFINRPDCIDFSDEHGTDSNIGLSDFLDFYNRLPSVLKRNSSRIVMENSNKRCVNVGFDTEFMEENVIHITTDAFGFYNSMEGGIKRMLAHELFHSLDVQYKYSDEDKMLISKVMGDERLSDGEYDELNKLVKSIDDSSLSNSPLFKLAFKKDGQRYVSAYGAKYALDNGGGLKENFADVGSMAVLDVMGEVDSARIKNFIDFHNTPLGANVNGDIIDLNSFKNDVPNQFNYALNLLSEG